MTSREGHCAMRGSCGAKEWFKKELPCPTDDPASEDDVDRKLLVELCGAEFTEGPTCCTTSQLETLRDNLVLAENMIASCPACRNNFRTFWCSFTCSPNQATFLNVTSTQKSITDQTAVASVDFTVSETFGEGFFNSCKGIQMGATNSYAMDFIGGGAKDYKGFFRYMGDVKDLGSPFQINFPDYHSPDLVPLSPTVRNCYDSDLQSRCACLDCPSLCEPLPSIDPPNAGGTCHVGGISCLTFVLIIAYGLAVLSFVVGYILQITIRRRRERMYERVALSVDAASVADTPLSPHSHHRRLVGASSLAQSTPGDGASSPTTLYSDSRQLGRGASLLDPLDIAQPHKFPLNAILRRFFYRLGHFCASHPFLTFAIVFTVCGVLNAGWSQFEVETDPVRLWVAKDSESRIQKEFFDQHFGPFYRAEQVFVTSVPYLTNLRNNSTDVSVLEEKPPVLSWDTLKYWAKIESQIRQLESYPNGYRLDDVCFKPAGPDGFCIVQSALAWFGNDLSEWDEDTWASHLLKCAQSPVQCLPDFQQPLGPEFVLGGVPVNEDGKKQYLDTKSLVINYVVSDSLDKAEQAKAEEWERALRSFLLDLQYRIEEEAGLQIAWSTGISLEEEINKSTNTDVRIVVLSYVAMFIYVALTLGGRGTKREESFVSSFVRWAKNFPKLFRKDSNSASLEYSDIPTLLPKLPTSFLVNSKVTLGLFGIVQVLLSVSSSVGFFSFLGVKATLIIAEVIPFLVLAVGVDNVFILVGEVSKVNASFAAGTNGATIGSETTPMSPTQPRTRLQMDSTQSQSSVDTALTPLPLPPVEERIARALAKIGPSILLSTITEVVAFGLGAIVPMPAVRNFALYAAGSVLLGGVLSLTVFVSALCLDIKRTEAKRVDCFPCIRIPSRIQLPTSPAGRGAGEGVLRKFIRKRYAPWLVKPVTKGIILLAFAGVFVASVISIQHVELGFDQRLALPSESYLIPYFDHLDAYLEIGPPVYFVIHDANVDSRSSQKALCGRFTTCSPHSVANILEAARKAPESSYIAAPTASWIDDYLSWLNPSQEKCCRVRRRNPDIFCRSRESARLCKACWEDHEPAWNITMKGLPEGEEFMKYLQQWLVSPTTEDCPLAGKASFGTALALNEDGSKVAASHFRTSHAPLKSQSDFINSFHAAHRLADDMSKATGLKVFPYSLHYVFFDQYAHIIPITQQILGLGLAAVLLVTALLLGSWRTGCIVTGTVGLTVVSVMGVMGVWGISLNAISLVNLVISLGIAVEFCAHIARAFMSAGHGLPADHPAGQKERDERVVLALIDVGPSVLSGITFTKLIGMCVLALTRSRLLEIYYFRMWITLIFSGALHGLVFLPVILSIAGGPGFPQEEADEEWMSHAARNDYGYTPFLADDDSAVSD